MARPKVEIDTRGFGKVMAGSEVAGALEGIAEEKASAARSSAPVVTGEYRDSIDVESDTWRRGAAQMARSRVVAHDRKSLIVEAKTGNLKRALRR